MEEESSTSGWSLRNLFFKPLQLWTASVPEDSEDPYMQSIARQSQLRMLLNLPPLGISSDSVSHKRDNVQISAEAIPSSFDARDKWPSCKSIIDTVPNQGDCGSCWAVSAASVLSDRYCISRGGSDLLSSQYLVYCSMSNTGCSGSSNTISVWKDIKEIGVPTEQCIPYNAHNGKCPDFCDNGENITDSTKVFAAKYNIPWDKDAKARVEAIQREIMTNGPVQATYMVFSDFYSYFFNSDGVYHRSATAYQSGGHAVRIIGWGTEAGEDYWLVCNSWGTSRGGKDFPLKGYFRIRRGNNECGIESEIATGLVKA